MGLNTRAPVLQPLPPRGWVIGGPPGAAAPPGLAGTTLTTGLSSLVVDTIPTLAWSAGADGSVDFLNQRWLVYTGLSAEEALVWGVSVTLHPEVVIKLAG